MLNSQHATSATPSAMPSSCEASTEVVFQSKPLSAKEVKGALGVTRITSAVGSDGMLKISCKGISSVVTNIFNKSLTCELFPTAWKKAVETPVYKKKLQI